jgi:hypothetical protein
MKAIALILLSFVFVPQLPPQNVVGTTVETTSKPGTNFASFKTYSWIPGWNAEIPSVHTKVVAAIESELGKLGFTKVATGANVTVAYYTVRSTDVDLKALSASQQQGSTSGTAPRTVGRLVVMMRPGDATTETLWSASTREFIDPNPAAIDNTIQTATARLFAAYPTRQPASR